MNIPLHSQSKCLSFVCSDSQAINASGGNDIIQRIGELHCYSHGLLAQDHQLRVHDHY